jgi:putative ABC transport system ATP-binding protein
MSIITTKNISKIYRTGRGFATNALNDVSIEIKTGEFCSIVGASGSGKSTLLSILGGAEKQTSGEYFFNGEIVPIDKESERVDHRRRRIGYILQNFMLIEDRSVLENVMTPLLLDNTTSFKEMKEMAMTSIEKVGLKALAKKRVTHLSGGERQRVAIARAIVKQKNVLLADEPTGQLDSENADQIMKILTDVNKTGITLIVVTHNSKISALAQRVISLSDGRITGES